MLRFFAGLLIITKFPPCPHTPLEVPRPISRIELQQVILNHAGIELLLDNVLRYLNDYVLLTRSYDKASRILSVPYIQVENHVLAIVG